MDIIGTGLDATEISRIAETIERFGDRFRQRGLRGTRKKREQQYHQPHQASTWRSTVRVCAASHSISPSEIT